MTIDVPGTLTAAALVVAGFFTVLGIIYFVVLIRDTLKIKRRTRSKE